MARVLHVTTSSAWAEARARGVYTAPSLASEGFIHFSTRAQLLPTANLLFAGHTDLLVLEVDPERVSAPLRFEAPAGPAAPGISQRFPHLYGPLELEAVVGVHELRPSDAGDFVMPPGLAESAG